jgi:hypothetical protein
MLANTGGSLFFLLILLVVKLLPMAYLSSRNKKFSRENDGIDLKQQRKIDSLTKSSLSVLNSGAKPPKIEQEKALGSSASKVTTMDKFMIKMNDFLSANFFLMMVHGL